MLSPSLSLSIFHFLFLSPVQPQGKRCKGEWQQGNFTTSKKCPIDNRKCVFACRCMCMCLYLHKCYDILMYIRVHTFVPALTFIKSVLCGHKCLCVDMYVCVCMYLCVPVCFLWIKGDISANSVAAFNSALTLCIIVTGWRSDKDGTFRKFSTTFGLKCHLVLGQTLLCGLKLFICDFFCLYWQIWNGFLALKHQWRFACLDLRNVPMFI